MSKPTAFSAQEPRDFDAENAVAVCVGVEDYLHGPAVTGACRRAGLVFETLTRGDTAACNSPKSRLLQNPTHAEFHRFLESYTYFLKPSDHLLVYYCGSSSMVDGKAVMCLHDTAILPGGVVNPFTVHGWQSFFQLASVVRARSLVFLWESFGFGTTPPSRSGFREALRGGASTLPLSSNIPWAIAAVHHEESGCVAEGGNREPAGGLIHEFLFDPPDRHTGHPYVGVEALFRTVRKKIRASLTGQLSIWTANGDSSHCLVVCRNPRSKLRTERFIPHYVHILRAFANLPHGEYSPQEILGHVSPAAWKVANKLSYEPWALITDGSRKGLKRITRKGRGFLRGTQKVPLVIAQTGKGWKAHGPQTADIRFFREREKAEARELEEMNRQMKLFG